MVNNLFFNNARLGKTNLWRFLLTLVIIVFSYFLGMFVAIMIAKFVGLEKSDIKLSPIIRILISRSEFIFGLIGLLLAVKFVHQRKLITLFTSKNKFAWNKFLFAFVLMLILELAQIGIQYLLFKETFTFVFEFKQFLPFFLISLVIVPIQSSFEEIFHRGYFTQTLANWLRYPWLVILLTSIFFSLIHIKHAVLSIEIIYIISFGIIAGIIVFITEGLEIVMAMHSIHNLMSLISHDSTYTDPSIFISSAPDGGLLGWLIVPVIFLLLIFLKYGTSKLRLIFKKITF